MSTENERKNYVFKAKLADQAQRYRKKIEEELSEFCSDILMILENNLLTSTRSVEATIFYLKMRGDYFRYLAEFKSGLKRKEVVDKSMKGYEEAFAAAETELPSTHPIRLGLALNFSIFYYKIMNNRKRAYQIAQQAFDEAVADLENSYEESYNDITLIMQLLQDSRTLYTHNLPDDRGDENLKNEEAKPTELLPTNLLQKK